LPILSSLQRGLSAFETFPQLAGLFVIADRHFVALLLRALPRGSGMLVMRTGKLDKISL